MSIAAYPLSRRRFWVAPSLSRDARRRLRWMEFYLAHGRRLRLTCRHFGISSATFYRWFTTLIFAGPPSQGWEHVLGAIARSERLLADLGPAFIKALGPEDVTRAHAAGRRCIIYNLQNAEPVGDMLDRVDTLYGLGVRVVQLTYNLRNLYGDGCVERRDGGLSRFGVHLVEKLNARRIVIDTSHCSDQTTLDAVDASAQPIAVTHTCARALSGHPRGKPDPILRAVADSGGYIGVVICPFMLTRAGARATLDDVADHVLHIVNVAGTGAVGIGTDWGKPYYRIMDWTYESIVEGLRPGEFDWVGWLPEHHFDPAQGVCRDGNLGPVAASYGEVARAEPPGERRRGHHRAQLPPVLGGRRRRRRRARQNGRRRSERRTGRRSAWPWGKRGHLPDSRPI